MRSKAIMHACGQPSCQSAGMRNYLINFYYYIYIYF